MNSGIEKHIEEIRWCENQLQRKDLSWKRRKDIERHKHRLKKELRICEQYLRGEI